MSAIYEYGKRKEQKGIEKGRKEGKKEEKEEIIHKLYESGMTPEEISKRLKTDLEKIKKIDGIQVTDKASGFGAFREVADCLLS